MIKVDCNFIHKNEIFELIKKRKDNLDAELLSEAMRMDELEKLEEDLISHGVIQAIPEPNGQQETAQDIIGQHGTREQIKEEDLCKACGKSKLKHIPCTTNDTVFWCYDNKKTKSLEKCYMKFTTKAESEGGKKDE